MKIHRPNFKSIKREKSHRYQVHKFTSNLRRDSLKQELQQLKALHQHIFSNISDVVVITDQAGEFIYISPNVNILFGYSLPEVQNMGNLSQLFAQIGLNESLLKTTEEQSNIESPVTDKDGKKRRILVKIQLLDFDKTTILYNFSEITEQKNIQSDDQLQQSQQVYQSLVHSLNGLVWELDLSTLKISFVSQKAEQILGYPIESWLSEANFWNNHIHPEDRQRVLDSKHQMVESLQDSQIEYRMIAADGRIVWLQDIASIVVENGQAIKLRGVMVDISERQAALKEHKQVEITLQQTIEREKLLGATAQRIRQSLDLDKILNTTVTEVRQLLQADRTVIFRFETNWSGVVIVESVITPELSILDTNIYDPCFSTTYIEQYKQGRIRAIEDILKADIAQCHINLLSQFQVRSNLVVPILQGEKLWGLLIAHQCDQPRQWQPHETELLEQLATQVGIAIGQSQLYQQTQRQAQREQALNQVIQAIRTSLNLEKIFSTATEEVCKLLQVERTIIARYLADQKLWRNVADYHLSPDAPSVFGLEFSAQENEMTTRLKQLKVFRIDNAKYYPEAFNQDYADSFPGTWLMIPLHFDSVLWGSLSLVRNHHHTSWETWEIELASAVADQLAIAIKQSELYQQLEQLAILDGLTQIANRRYFDQYLDQEWKRAQREQHSLSLLLLDVDHFKLYNDTYGHQAGDYCLQQVAQTIQQTLKRSSDLVARYGGEEFVVLLPNTNAEGAIQVAQEIHEAVQKLAIEHSRSSVSEFVTMSIGISTTIPTLYNRFEALVSRADKALYEAKQQRNTYCFSHLVS